MNKLTKILTLVFAAGLTLNNARCMDVEGYISDNNNDGQYKTPISSDDGRTTPIGQSTQPEEAQKNPNFRHSQIVEQEELPIRSTSQIITDIANNYATHDASADLKDSLRMHDLSQLFSRREEISATKFYEFAKFLVTEWGKVQKVLSKIDVTVQVWLLQERAVIIAQINRVKANQKT